MIASLTSPDRHRPRYHFTAPTNWINDPNGLCFHDGRWHLHYQYNPNAPQWGDIHWGHASSADLMHWRDEPLALAPSAGEDEGGFFSGCFALVNGMPTLYYTGYSAARQVQCVATGTPDLSRWTKHPERTIAEPPAGVEPHDFRDPCVFQHDGHWYMVVGASLHHQRGQALLYRSDDGITWQAREPLYTAPDERLGVMWECPNFFPLGDGSRWVLLVSHWLLLGVHAFVGRFENERFTPEWDGPFDVDGGAFAPLTMRAPDGRMLQWAWMNEQREQAHINRGGWAGAMTVPRELGLDAQGRLTVRPAAEIAGLREAAVAVTPTGDSRGTLAQFAGTALDIEARFSGRNREKVGLTLLASPDGRERTRIVYWQDARRLTIEREHSSLSTEVRRQNLHTTLLIAEDEPLRLRVLLDGSVLEVYANDQVCLSTRVYPTLAESVQASAFSEGKVTLYLQVWAMGAMFEGERQPLSKP
jgi:beta-fructofuranosidase